jgi:hypothetical protein
MSKTRKWARQTQPEKVLKLFQPMSWYDFPYRNGGIEFLEHLLKELGRLNVDDRYLRGYPQETLSNLLEFSGSQPSEAYARLVDWKNLNLEQLIARWQTDPEAKPRIEIHAEITSRDNLSVCWYPAGWRKAVFDLELCRDGDHYNMIPKKRWPEPPDFSWFSDYAMGGWDARKPNELMFIRGVGRLRPQPPRSLGEYSDHNFDVVDSILICAVRAAYESLIERLRNSFDVTVIDTFDFEIVPEKADPEAHYPINRVVGWKLVNAAKLKARREQEEVELQNRIDRIECDHMESIHEVSPTVLINALVEASVLKRPGPPRSVAIVNRNAGTLLRARQCKISEATVGRLRGLVERYHPELVPASLITQGSDAAAAADQT